MAEVEFDRLVPYATEKAMKRPSLRLTALLASAALGLALAATVVGDAASADPQPGAYGPGYGYGFGMGPGRAGGLGMGPGMSGGTWPGAYWVDANHDGTLTVDEVKAFLEARHTGPMFANLKVGAIKEKDSATITAELTAEDGTVVRTLEFPRHVDAGVAGRPGYGYGPGMGAGYYGPAMRQGNFGPAMRGGFGRGARQGGPGGFEAGLLADGVVTVDEIKGIVERHLARWNNPNLKVGEVKAKDDKTISADIVTKDGSLVQHMEFDSKTGRPLWNR